MNGKAFVDTNIVVYAVSGDTKSAVARATLGSAQTLSLQVLNEYAHVARRKQKRSPEEIAEVTRGFRENFEIRPITMELHDEALVLCGRYGYGFFDSLLIATALEAGCTTLYSEDLQHRQLIDKRLRIINPFV